MNYNPTKEISYNGGFGETFETVAYDVNLWNAFKEGKFKYSQNGSGYLGRCEDDTESYLDDLIEDEMITEDAKKLILDNVVMNEFLPIEFCNEYPDIVDALNLFDYDECDVDEEKKMNIDGIDYTVVSFAYDWD